MPSKRLEHGFHEQVRRVRSQAAFAFELGDEGHRFLGEDRPLRQQSRGLRPNGRVVNQIETQQRREYPERVPAELLEVD
ncbi:MAG TPA: hypothetical protein VK816_04165, partial [Jatrophihabitantaceae bacterium]|nr:hypothetical protein [Jatrophihabitantaceae bacterium]